MQHLYAPWRGTYAKKTNHHEHLKNGCPFCNMLKSTNDAEHYIIKRYPQSFVLLNSYPYNPGHLLIVPNTHAAELDELTPEVRAELMEVATHATTIMAEHLGNSGTNIGLNLGDSASGGSIPEHLHVHIVPRWKGDTGFLPVLAQTKPLSEDLNLVYETLKKVF